MLKCFLNVSDVSIFCKKGDRAFGMAVLRVYIAETSINSLGSTIGSATALSKIAPPRQR